MLLFSVIASASNKKTTYQAKIVKPDGYPLESAAVNFRFTVLDPSASCVLFVENYSAVNMIGTGGLINLSLGSGSRSYPLAGPVTFSDAFDNSIQNFNCQTLGTYSPNPDDTRKIVMQFSDGGGWQTIPAMTINSVPYSMYAGRANNSSRLEGKASADFVEHSTLAALNCSAGQLLTYNNAGFACVNPPSPAAAVSNLSVSGSVLSISGPSSSPVISITAVSLSNDGYLSSIDYAEFKAKPTSSAVASLISQAQASQTTLTVTMISQAQTSQTVATTSLISQAQVSQTATTASMIAQAQASQTATTASMIAQAQVSQTAATASLISQAIASQALSGDVTGLASANTVSQVGGQSAADISASVNMTEAASSANAANAIVRRDASGNFTANDIYANSTKTNYADLYKPSTNFSVRLRAPTSLNSNYILTLPNSDGDAGQILTSDGSGNLMWMTPLSSSGTATSVASPLSASGGVISLPQANSTQDGYLTSADFDTFNNKQNQSSELNALSATAALGILQRTGTATYVGLGLGAPLQITAGNITLNLSSDMIVSGSALALSATGVSPGSYTKIIVDSKGRVTSGSTLTNADIVAALGYTPSNSATTSANYLDQASNLSDLTSSATARTNLGLGSLATSSSVDLATAQATGTLAAARLPSFAGDVSSVSGSNVLTLANSGVNSGTYAKVSVDSKGRVISGSTLTNADIVAALGYTPSNSATTSTNYLDQASNLSDLASSATARTNLGLGSLATSSSVDLGTAQATGTLAAARLPSLAGDVSSVSGSNTVTVTRLRNRTVANTAPSLGAFMKWNNTLSQWEPYNIPSCNTASAVMHYNSITDVWSCDTLNVGSVSGTLSVANGGTGLTSLTDNALVIGNGTSALTALTPGTSGSILISQGTSSLPIWAPPQWVSSGANIYFNTGNVGIGSVAVAGRRLVVRGPSSTSSDFALVAENSSGVAILATRNDGRVGIGNTAPTEELDVSGTVRANDIKVGTAIIVNSSGYVIPAATAVEGADCNAVGDGAIARDASGNLLVCN